MEKATFEDNKEYNDIYKKGREVSKRKTCMICGKECTSFCNSHTLPQMVLKHITQNGELNTAFWQFGDKNNPNAIRQTIGKNNAGVFNSICRECDATVFKDYECEQAYLKEFTDKILNLITLKTSLYMNYKYKIQAYADSILCSDLGNIEYLDATNKRYAQEFEEDVEVCKELLNSKKTKFQYKVLFWKKLNYKIPIATQTVYGLRYNFKGMRVMDEPLVYVLACPFEKYSIICLYCKNDEQTIRNIAFPNNVSWINKLSLINNLILAHSEEYFVAKELEKILDVSLKQKLKNMSHELEIASISSISKQISYFTKNFDYPNLLLEKYSIK